MTVALPDVFRANANASAARRVLPSTSTTMGPRYTSPRGTTVRQPAHPAEMREAVPELDRAVCKGLGHKATGGAVRLIEARAVAAAHR